MHMECEITILQGLKHEIKAMEGLCLCIWGVYLYIPITSHLSCHIIHFLFHIFNLCNFAGREIDSYSFILT